MNLTALGWNEFHEKHYNKIKTPNTFPARVAKAEREKYVLYSDFGELKADIKGKLRFGAESSNDFPAVGDWVVASMRKEGNAATVEAILPRRNKFSRKVAGTTTDEQVMVANIDTVFLVNGLDGDYNVRRLERYLALARENNSSPVVVLNKTDKSPDLPGKVNEVTAVACGIPVVTMSALNNEGIQNIRKYISSGTTVAFLGSSGVGKSTIINRLLGEEKLKVGAVRESDSRGMHITTNRELILLPSGGVVIDNPGMRELQLWVDKETLENTFNDLRELSENCKFRDCKHQNEPGCAVKSAIETGNLDNERLQNYIKLKEEIKRLEARTRITPPRGTKRREV